MKNPVMLVFAAGVLGVLIYNLRGGRMTGTLRTLRIAAAAPRAADPLRYRTLSCGVIVKEPGNWTSSMGRSKCLVADFEIRVESIIGALVFPRSESSAAPIPMGFELRRPGLVVEVRPMGPSDANSILQRCGWMPNPE